MRNRGFAYPLIAPDFRPFFGLSDLAPLHKEGMAQGKGSDSEKPPKRSVPILFPMGFGVKRADDILILEFFDSELVSGGVLGSFAFSRRAAEEFAKALNAALASKGKNS